MAPRNYAYSEDKRRCEAIVAVIPDNAEVTDPYIMSVLRCHRNWKERPGQVIRKVRLTNRCALLHAYTASGKYIDTIGLLSALADKHNVRRRSDSPTYFARQAFRRAIHYQIMKARGSRDSNRYEVDHVGVDFEVLLKRFLALYGLGLTDVETKRTPGSWWPQLIDKEMERRWQGYHRKHAVLEVVTTEEHKRRTLQRRRLNC
jgi:hypothetical protein